MMCLIWHKDKAEEQECMRYCDVRMQGQKATGIEMSETSVMQTIQAVSVPRNNNGNSSNHYNNMLILMCTLAQNVGWLP